MIQFETELDGKLIQIRDIKDAEIRNDLEKWRLRIFDSLLTTPCPVCNSASRAIIVLSSDDGELLTRFHSFCHEDFIDVLKKLLPAYLKPK